MDRNAIRTEDQRLERNRLIEYNRQKRRGETINDEQSLSKIENKQLMVSIYLFI